MANMKPLKESYLAGDRDCDRDMAALRKAKEIEAKLAPRLVTVRLDSRTVVRVSPKRAKEIQKKLKQNTSCI